jgi:hypothetical protein
MAKAKPAAPAAAPAKPSGGKVLLRRFTGLKKAETRPILVELPGGPKIVVDATNVEDAWEKYKAIAGIVSSDHQPKFSRPGADCLTNEHGIVVNENGEQQLANTKRPDDGKGDWDLEEELED